LLNLVLDPKLPLLEPGNLDLVGRAFEDQGGDQFVQLPVLGLKGCDLDRRLIIVGHAAILAQFAERRNRRSGSTTRAANPPSREIGQDKSKDS
jgi:hypothetical protein